MLMTKQLLTEKGTWVPNYQKCLCEVRLHIYPHLGKTDVGFGLPGWSGPSIRCNISFSHTMLIPNQLQLIQHSRARDWEMPRHRCKSFVFIIQEVQRSRLACAVTNSVACNTNRTQGGRQNTGYETSGMRHETVVATWYFEVRRNSTILL